MGYSPYTGLCSGSHCSHVSNDFCSFHDKLQTDYRAPAATKSTHMEFKMLTITSYLNKYNQSRFGMTPPLVCISSCTKNWFLTTIQAIRYG